MSLFDRDQMRQFARASLALLLCGFAASLTGCASGQRQSLYGGGRFPSLFGQPPASTPTPAPTLTPTPSPAITPGTSPQPPSQSGPVILPRDSFLKQRPNAFVQQRRSPSPARLTAPIIDPRQTSSPQSLPSIRYSDPPAAFSGGIEIVPNSPQIGSTSHQKHFDIMPTEPSTRDTDDETQFNLFSNEGYVELPPPPE